MVVVACSACTSNPKTHGTNTTFNPSAENVVTQKLVLHIAKDFLLTYHPPWSGLGPSEVKMGLMEGDYVAVLKDEHGIYYQGLGWCVYRYGVGRTSGIVMRGGLYIPNADEGEGPIVYWNTDIGGIGSVKIAADGFPIPSELSSDAGSAALGNYVTIQANNSPNVASAAGTGLAEGLIKFAVQGTIGFWPTSEKERPLMRELMKYVTKAQ